MGAEKPKAIIKNVPYIVLVSRFLHPRDWTPTKTPKTYFFQKH